MESFYSWIVIVCLVAATVYIFECLLPVRTTWKHVSFQSLSEQLFFLKTLIVEIIAIIIFFFFTPVLVMDKYGNKKDLDQISVDYDLIKLQL